MDAVSLRESTISGAVSCRSRQWLGADVHLAAFADGVEEPDDVARGHADAAETGGGAESGLLGCAVDVDVATVGVSVPTFLAAEPQDAGHDGIAPGGIDGNDFAGGSAALEFHSDRLAGANLFSDFESPKRGAVRAGNITQSKTGSGNGESGEELVFLEDGHALFRHGNHDVMASVSAGGEKNQAGGKGDGCEAAGELHAVNVSQLGFC